MKVVEVFKTVEEKKKKVIEYILFVCSYFLFYCFSDPRPRKSLWIISRLLFFVLAIEFTDALETALTVPILTSLHLDES